LIDWEQDGNVGILEIADVLDQVDGERIYQHVLQLQGTRHPIDSPQRLSDAADYICSEFKRSGLHSGEQVFRVPGFDGVFRNAEGVIEHADGAELLVVAHYDTVEESPGANDNASGVAVMLEAARVLAQQRVISVRFVGFTLEELNPAYALKSRQMAQSFGLKNAQNHYTSLQTHNTMKNVFELQRKYWTAGKGASDALAAARMELGAQMNEAEVAYVKQLERMYEEITPTSWPGKTATLGSSFWVDEAVRTNKNVAGALCFDTVGYSSDKEHSQRFPPGMKPEMFQTHEINNAAMGNFLAVVGDVNSGELIQSFSAQSALDSVKLPCAALRVPLRYEQIAGGMGDLLRSDHAPFWRQGIPAIFMTDTADFRYPYYHTQADTIDKLDFTFITKTCKATVATAVKLTGK
jgi:hypothetical protein